MSGLVFHLIPHTHWDREWYLPHAAFLARLVPAIDDLTATLERDPAYRSFLLDGQTILIEDYLRVRPERRAGIAALVRGGRLAVGPWYVLADELIPSGEALLRNLLLGSGDAEELGGRMNVLYSPDAFGHPAILPTLAREFDLRFGVVWRGLGGEPGQDRDLYRWRGPDGKEILLWHLPRSGYEIGADLAHVPPDPESLREIWARVRERLVARAGTEVPVFVGADHHAAFEHIPRLRDALAQLEPESVFRVSRLEEFFGALEPAGEVLAGELRWSYGYTWTLQGVHGTRAPLKRRNSMLELWLERFAEPLAALARMAGGRDRRPLLDAAWRELIACQFHDTIAGSTSDAVATAVGVRFTSVESMAREIVRGSVQDLVHHDPDGCREPGRTPHPTLVLWNPAARARAAISIADVTFFRRDVGVGPPSPEGSARLREGPGYQPFAFRGPGDAVIPVQVLDQRRATERLDALHAYPDQDEVDHVRVAFQAPVVPGLGTVVCTLDESRPLAVPFGVRVRRRAIANAWVEVRVDPNGTVSLRDRRSGERYRGIGTLEWQSDAGDTYTFAPVGPETRALPHQASVRPVARGPLVGALETTYVLSAGTAPDGGAGRVAVRLTLALHADSPVLRGVLELDNQAVNHRLRARFSTGVPGVPASVGAPFGAIARPAPTALRDYPMETPVQTAPAHRFAAVARARRGLAVLAPGFFEYECTSQGDLLVTLLRAVGELSRPDLPTRPGHAGWPTPTPLAQCLGPTRIEFGVVPVTATAVERGDELPAIWEDCFLPLRGFWIRNAVGLTETPVDIALEGPGLVFSAAKPAEAGAPLALRCYNATDRPVMGAWRFGRPVGAAYRVRADERASTPLPLDGRGHTVRFSAEPHELVTILIT
ncbi:MAG TPA: glycoside hydrolase family 38 C-terminal domain-containing protein [Gemmatimonadales bacterium]|nr:glycoside hydrolase family 38 C-terminal domain-containing protein [Gemmatimonadales bacterium]